MQVELHIKAAVRQSLPPRPSLTYSADLSCKDDFESASFALLRLLKGNLPWTDLARQKHFKPNIDQQVEYVKRSYSGSRLFATSPDLFARIHDEITALPPGQTIDYEKCILATREFQAALPAPLEGEDKFDPIQVTPFGELLPSFDGAPDVLREEPIEAASTTQEVTATSSAGAQAHDPPSPNSYLALDISEWDYRQGERLTELTLPTGVLDETGEGWESLPRITEVTIEWASPIFVPRFRAKSSRQEGTLDHGDCSAGQPGKPIPAY
jgi:hypothetical protein